MVADGDFREDLMFRINTFEVRLPPLRDAGRSSPLGSAPAAPVSARPASRRCGIFRPTRFCGAFGIALLAGKCPRAGECRRACGDLCVMNCRSGPSVCQCTWAKEDSKAPHFTTDRSASTSAEIELSRSFSKRSKATKGTSPRAQEELGISLKTLYNKLDQVTQTEQSA